MTGKWIICCLGTACMLGAALAEPPTHITRPPSTDRHPIDIPMHDPGPATGDIIYDSLCITDLQVYENGYGDTCGGSAIFGNNYDLQTADDFVVTEECDLTGVVMDYVTFTGACPPLVCISVFPDNGNCLAPEAPICYVEIAPTVCIPFTDTIFGLAGVRVVVKTDASLCHLLPGRYWITMNPKMTDWGYVIVDTTSPPACGDNACDVLIRDGQNDNPCCTGNDGFGLPNWTPSGQLFGAKATMAMQIQVQCGPRQPQWIYQIIKVKRYRDQCLCLCQQCKHRVGDIVCYDKECFGNNPPDRIKAYEQCNDCSSCRAILVLIGNDICPENAKKCRCGP